MFVPEGNISPASGHMASPGTISMREETFRLVLTDLVHSLKAHGFTRIILIGDSGGNQSGQRWVADSVTKIWQGSPIVAHIQEYYDYASVFARQVEAHGRAGGVLWGISTSGNSGNVVSAFEAARRLGMHTLALTGAGGGRLAAQTDVLIDVPSRSTPRIQEMHLPIYHYICEELEKRASSI